MAMVIVFMRGGGLVGRTRGGKRNGLVNIRISAFSSNELPFAGSERFNTADTGITSLPLRLEWDLSYPETHDRLQA